MAGNLTDFLENKLLEHSTGKTEWSAPTETYAALFIVAPGEATTGTEVSATGYERAPSAGITWGTAASGSIANSAPIRFPESGNASVNWGTVTALGIFDSSSGGNLLWYGTLSASVTINSGDNYTISTGGLTLSID